MFDYIDNEGKTIKKGFYEYNDFNKLIYFTGKYDEAGFPIFEKEEIMGETEALPSFLVDKLSRINKREIKRRVKDLKEKINWLEKGLED
jgi:hypothetical protein